MDKIHFIYRYLIHLFTAKNTRGHGIHSPFLFSFIQEVIYEKNPFYSFSSIEELRKKLLNDKSILDITDFGAGQKYQATVSNIARTSLKSKKWSQMLFRSVNFRRAEKVLELGTSLGISAAYMASVNSGICCVTLEGASEIADVAQGNFEKLNLQNIKIITGNIDETLSQALLDLGTVDFAFFDANHRRKPTLDYFHYCLQYITEKSVFVFDDIYWSKEMTQAWQAIKQEPSVTSTIDLFQMGIVFFNKRLPKKNYKMR